MAQRTCSVDGCERIAEKRGWCPAHYHRWQRHDDPLGGGPSLGPRNNGRRCSAEGCERLAVKRTLCQLHYQRQRLANAAPKPPCSIEDCERPQVGRGWCHTHYKRWQMHGDPLMVIMRVSQSLSPCAVPECYLPAKTRGWCGAHYQRWLATGDPTKRPSDDPAPDGYKTCRACVAVKPFSAFHPHRKGRGGYAEICKDCRSVRDRAAYAREPERRRQRRRDYVERNREEVYARAAAWWRAHPDVAYAIQARRRASLLAAWVEDVSRMEVYARDLGRCGICGETVSRRRFHVDHVIPLSRGGEHSYANVQLAHPRCNMAKGDKMPEEYAALLAA